MSDSPVKLVWLQVASNPMSDSPVQSAWLQMARNLMMDSMVQSVCYKWPGTPCQTPR